MWCWAGQEPHQTGSWSGGRWMRTRAIWEASQDWQARMAKRQHLRDDGEFWLCRNSVLSSASSPGPGGLPPSCRHRRSGCRTLDSRATAGASSWAGSGPPRRLGSCRDSVYSSEKLLGGGAGRAQCQAGVLHHLSHPGRNSVPFPHPPSPTAMEILFPRPRFKSRWSPCGSDSKTWRCQYQPHRVL